MNTLFILILLVILGYFIDNLAKREKAKAYAKKLVDSFNLQFLDDSIFCAKMKIIRGVKYPYSIQRKYHFYASPFSEKRLQCYLVMNGSQMSDWYIEPYSE
jgi:hypothetical protein